MGLKQIYYKNKFYPQHEAEGYAARWILPMAQYYCKGKGFDIGYCKQEWKLPGAIGIDYGLDCNAMRLPPVSLSELDSDEGIDYIFSSHCLEHIRENWYNVLDYWISQIKTGGILFLYLPHKSQEYWLPKNNRKHIHSFDGSEIGDYLTSLGHDVFVGGCDANHSFVVIAEIVNDK